MAFAAAELGLRLAMVDVMPTGAKGTYGDGFRVGLLEGAVTPIRGTEPHTLGARLLGH